MPATEVVPVPEGGGEWTKVSRWAGWGFATLLGLFLVLAYSSPLRSITPETGLDPWIERFRDLGPWAPVTFVLVVAVAVGVGLPRLLLATLGGALFGGWWGFCLSQIGTCIGCWLTFLGGRTLGPAYLMRTILRRRPRAGHLLERIRRRGVMANILIRTVPVGSCFVTNLLMSVTSIRHRTFLVGTFLGVLPLTLAGVLIGSGGREVAVFQVLGGVFLLGMTGMMQRLWKRGREEDADPNLVRRRVEIPSKSSRQVRKEGPALNAFEVPGSPGQ